MKVKFNLQQQDVFDRLIEFVENDKNHDTFILSGYAGTGKTFLIQQFADYLIKHKRKFSLLATTGRAAAVLRGKTNHITSTIHGALYTFSKIDGDDDSIPADALADAYGQMQLVFEPKIRMEEECIFIVDESSMLASEAFDEVSSFARFGSGNLLPDLLHAIGKNKIIFVGDPCQLPPIGQEICPALDKEWLDDFGRKTIQKTLSQIMRTDKDNDILLLSAAVRNKIGKTANKRWITMPARNRNNTSVVPDANSLFLEYYARFLQYGPEESIGIAPSNRLCNRLNSFFRKRLFPDQDSFLEEGEILMVTQNNYIVPLSNGDFVRVLKLGDKSSKVNLHFQNIRVLHLTTEKEYEIKIALDPFANFGVNLTQDQQRNLMIDFSRRMKSKGIKPKSEEFLQIMRKDPYLNSLRASYGYVVTCHKAQGGEWKDVFLFMDKSIYGYMTHDGIRRWWYTAITRTKEQLYLHSDFWLE